MFSISIYFFPLLYRVGVCKNWGLKLLRSEHETYFSKYRHTLIGTAFLSLAGFIGHVPLFNPTDYKVYGTLDSRWGARDPAQHPGFFFSIFFTFDQSTIVSRDSKKIVDPCIGTLKTLFFLKKNSLKTRLERFRTVTNSSIDTN